MKKYNIFFSIIMLVFLSLALNACFNLDVSETPYHITREPMIIKNLKVPAGSILRYYGSCKPENCERDEPLNIKKLDYIEFPGDNLIIWGGMPVQVIVRHFKKDMKGFTVYPKLHMTEKEKEALAKKSEFLRLWFQWELDMEVGIKDENDWSFNPSNIELGGEADITNISINISNFRVIKNGIYDVEATNKKLIEHKRKLNEAAKRVGNIK